LGEDVAHGVGRDPGREASIDLFWIPLGAGASVVRLSGRTFEQLAARRQHRAPSQLYHSALVVLLDGHRFAIEMAPVPDGDGARRGVRVQGPVGLRAAAVLRVFRYEVRCWRDGVIPDLGEAVGGARPLAARPAVARRLLDLTAAVPALVWGRDELGAGEMWSSNSVTSWLLGRAGFDPEGLRPPPGGRAPGWSAGVAALRRSGPPEAWGDHRGG
jgi:hypothetical protein